MDSTASNLDTLPHAACNPLHSLWMHFTTLHGIQCIQLCRMESTAFNQDHAISYLTDPVLMLWIPCGMIECTG
ncbi:hypothetical protein PS028_23950, partial [Shigella sonnei]|nr:hypothetical protein [Shigella sonnei]